MTIIFRPYERAHARLLPPANCGNAHTVLSCVAHTFCTRLHMPSAAALVRLGAQEKDLEAVEHGVTAPSLYVHDFPL